MANKRFGFVSGDIGGTRMAVPARNHLVGLGHEVKFAVDGNGKGTDVLREAEINFQAFFDLSQRDFVEFIRNVDLMFIGTCASASGLEIEFANNLSRYPYNIPVVLGADGLFNHGLKKWQAVQADFWLAITEGHKQSILDLRPGLMPGRVKFVGQPAFDPAMDLIPRKEEIRRQRRSELGLKDNQKAVLWWSTGLGEIIGEDIEMAKVVAANLPKNDAVFIPRFHPKLEDTVRKGFINDARTDIVAYCKENRVHFILDDVTRRIPSEELCLATDAVVAITCTEDVKDTMMGGPLVVHLLGPVAREFYEKEWSLRPPHYFPDIMDGESLMATCFEDIPAVINQAFDQNLAKALRANWQPPKEKATSKVAETLLALAR